MIHSAKFLIRCGRQRAHEAGGNNNDIGACIVEVEDE